MSISARINSSNSRDVAVIGVRLLDDAHMTWFADEIESEQALHAWFDAAPPQGADAYAAYRAALDREEAAARDLQRLSQLTQPYQERLAREQMVVLPTSHVGIANELRSAANELRSADFE